MTVGPTYPAPAPPGETQGDPTMPSLRRSSVKGTHSRDLEQISSEDSRHDRFCSFLLPNFRRMMMRVMCFKVGWFQRITEPLWRHCVGVRRSWSEVIIIWMFACKKFHWHFWFGAGGDPIFCTEKIGLWRTPKMWEASFGFCLPVWLKCVFFGWD